MATDDYNENLDLIEVEPERIRTDYLTTLETALSESLYPGDERRIFAESNIAVLVSLFELINDRARQTTLKYARGQWLDALGYRVGTVRLPAGEAKTTLKFSTAEAKTYNIIIPRFTKATADNVMYFATDEETVLRAGQREVSVSASAVYGGSDYNGFLPGSIGTLVDLIPGINGVTNTTETAGGDDGEPYTDEGDNRYRERIRLAVNAFSVAGSAAAYEYIVRSANANVLSVKPTVPRIDIEETVVINDGKGIIVGDGINVVGLKIYPHGESTAAVLGVDYKLDYEYGVMTITLLEGGSLEDADSVDVTGTKDLAGYVYIYILMKGGVLPTEAECAEIQQYVRQSDRRPMSDYVHVMPAERVDYTIDITYYTTASKAAAVLETVEGENGAIRRYIEQQGSEIGAPLNPGRLESLIYNPDWSDAAEAASNVVVRQPTFTVLQENQIAYHVGEVQAERVIL